MTEDDLTFGFTEKGRLLMEEVAMRVLLRGIAVDDAMTEVMDEWWDVDLEEIKTTEGRE